MTNDQLLSTLIQSLAEIDRIGASAAAAHLDYAINALIAWIEETGDTSVMDVSGC